MHFIKMGVDYHTTPLDVREKLTFSESSVEQAMLALNKKEHVLENVILSTCNRTEVFAVVEDEVKGKEEITEFFTDWFEGNPTEIEPHLKYSASEEVVRHAFRLTAGLDSMVLGETQILGQVREAFMMAQQNKTTGKHFNELFRRVITFGKQAHSDTEIGKQAVSISYVAVELTKNLFGDIRNKHAVILGAGAMGESTLKNLHGAGVSEITIINRNFEKAKELADRMEANADTMEELDQSLVQADILITSTGADEVILTKERLDKINNQRKNKPLFIIDIAVPRDVEESAGDLENIFLYDIDDLKSVADKNLEQRKKAAKLLESEIENELSSFKEWLIMLDVVPIIKALNEKSSRIQEETMDSIIRKIPDLEDREVKVLQKHTKSIVHQLLEQPIRQVKQIGASQYPEETKALFKAMFIETFGLEENLTKDK
ncbi:glutamyl-tRNA reductase [Oceanobacillus sp. CAU 1775]